MRRRSSASGIAETGTPPSVTTPSSTKRPSRSARRAPSSAPGVKTHVSTPGSTTRPVRSSTSSASGAGSAAGAAGSPTDGSIRRIGEHPLGADERAGDLVDRLGRHAQRDHEEGGIAVEGDELAGADLTLDREPRAEPGDDDDEDARQEHLRRVERRLWQGHPDTGTADFLRAAPVAVEEDPLAADAAQHPQAGDGVGPDRGQPAHLLPLLALARLERPDHRRKARDEDRHPDQDDDAEQRRRREQHRRDDEVRGDRTCEPRRDVERAAGPERVVRDGRDHLAGGQAPADRRPGERGVVRDDLDHPVARLQPVADRDAVAQRAGDRLDDAEPEEGGRPRDERLGVTGRDALVDRAAEHPRQQRLREHPDDPEGHAECERPGLMAPDPEQEPRRRTRVGRARIGEGELPHRRASVCAAPAKSAMMSPWPSGLPSR